MPSNRGATSLCPVCRSTFPNSRERNAHLAAEHAGWTLTWSGRNATLTDPAGAAQVITMRDFRELRRSAGGSAPIGDPVPAGGAPSPAPAAPGEPPEPPAEPRIPRVGKPADRPRSDPVVRAISRQAVEDAFSQAMLADLVRNLSRAVSEWDGAGERGVFSQIEAAQIASLLYDQTVSVIVRRFAGDVGRFKAAIAIILILAGKGRVHAQAIAERQRRVRAGLPPLAVPEPSSIAPAGEVAAESVTDGAAILPWAAEAPQPFSIVEGVSDFRPPRPIMPAAQPVSPDSSGGFVPLTPAMIAERQAAWARDSAPQDAGTAAALAGGPIESVLDRIFER